MNKKGLYKFSCDTGYGCLFGMFVQYVDIINYLIENKICVYFGEECGKYSEVMFQFDKDDVEFISDDEEFIKTVLDKKLCFGYDPTWQYVINAENGEFLVDNDENEIYACEYAASALNTACI